MSDHHRFSFIIIYESFRQNGTPQTFFKKHIKAKNDIILSYSKKIMTYVIFAIIIHGFRDTLSINYHHRFSLIFIFAGGGRGGAAILW